MKKQTVQVYLLKADFSYCRVNSLKNKIKMKEVIKVVLLDELKATLLAYEEPLKDLRDSL